jgi:hypothetical protein
MGLQLSQYALRKGSYEESSSHAYKLGPDVPKRYQREYVYGGLSGVL